MGREHREGRCRVGAGQLGDSVIAKLKASVPGSARSSITVGILVFVLTLPVLAVLRSEAAPHYPLSEQQAAAIARSDPRVRDSLAGRRVTGLRVTPLDDSEQRVSFFDGPRNILDAAVSARRVTHIADKPDGAPESGSTIANSGLVLGLLCALFLLATLSMPLRSLSNLDALVLAAFVVPVALLNANYVLASVLASYPLLLYLAARCLGVGLLGDRRAAGSPLFWHLTRAWPAPQQRRLLRFVVLAAAAIVAMVVPSSTGASDVAMAGAAGATDLLHGVAPYGHLPSFIFHGDTYPLLNYVLYIPGAALFPFKDAFSDPTGALLVSGTAVLLAAFGLYRIGTRLVAAEDARPDREDPKLAGMRVALAWLSFPPVILTASGGSNDVILAACVVLAFAFFFHPALSAFLLGLAAWVKVLPLLALPLWLARMSLRSALLALAGIAALSAVMAGWLLAIGGQGALTGMLDGLSFQLQRGSLHSLWIGLGIGALQPVAAAALVATVCTATLAVHRERELRSDLRRMAALFAAVMLIAQIAANYWTWAYLPWALVPILLSLLAPTALVPSAVEESRQVPVDHLIPGQQANQPA